MWILIKVLIAAIAFLVRLRSKYYSKLHLGNEEAINGVPLHIYKAHSKNTIASTHFNFAFETKSVFKLSVESGIDRFFKKIGVSEEVQTGDQAFDTHVYVASDSSFFRDEIKQDAPARDLIMQLFRHGCRAIHGNGHVISAKFDNDRSADAEVKQLCARLFTQFSDMDQNRKSIFHDPFALKAMVAEAVIWSLGAYSASSFFSWMLNSEDVHLNQLAVVRNGILIGVIAAALLIFLIAWVFNGSSRGHRILVESFIVLGLSLPVGSISAFCDLNTEMDRSESVAVEAAVFKVEERVRRSRKGGTTRTYHMRVGQTAKKSEYTLPDSIQISYEDYIAVRASEFVRIDIKPGWLHQPWYYAIQPISSLQAW